MHKKDVLSIDVGSISGAPGSDWQWLVEYEEEEQSTMVTVLRPSLTARVSSGDGVLQSQGSEA